MVFQPGAVLNTQSLGNRPENVEVPVYQTRAPTSSDWNYPVGKRWIDTVGLADYTLVAVTSSQGVNTATWNDDSGASGDFTTLTVTGQSTLGATTIVGTTLINASGSAVSTIGTGGTGAVHIGNATGNTAVTGSLTASTTLTATSGAITATNGNFTCTAVSTGLIFNPGATSGTTTATLNARVGQITITTPSIAAGATAAMTITNNQITGSTTQCIYSLTGGTTGAALTIQSYANTASQSVVTIQNGTGATTNTASLILDFIVLN